MPSRGRESSNSDKDYQIVKAHADSLASVDLLTHEQRSFAILESKSNPRDQSGAQKFQFNPSLRLQEPIRIADSQEWNLDSKTHPCYSRYLDHSIWALQGQRGTRQNQGGHDQSHSWEKRPQGEIWNSKVINRKPISRSREAKEANWEFPARVSWQAPSIKATWGLRMAAPSDHLRPSRPFANPTLRNRPNKKREGHQTNRLDWIPRLGRPVANSNSRKTSFRPQASKREKQIRGR